MTDPTIEVRKIGYSVQVAVRDGKPLCPHCHEPMIQTRPDEWQCAETYTTMTALRAMLEEGTTL